MSYGLFATLYESGEPFTLIDSRERRDYVAGHWFGSVNIPLSLFSNRIGYLFKSTDILINILDWEDSASAEAIYQLRLIGFCNITIHKTKHPPVMGRGFVKGEYVWSKAFGEVVAHQIDLPEVTPQQYLADYQDAMLLDVRPTAEYQDFTIPTSQNLPNSLLLANTQALKETNRVSLLHCAGRTRSIIGAFTLLASGYDGQFAVFRGGTQAWQLDGYEREHNANRLFVNDNEASDVVASFLHRWQIISKRVPSNELAAYTSAHNTELMFDVSDDAATGQVGAYGIIKISGTNLVQQTDRSIALFHVPITLFDHGSGSRAAFAAFWLHTMGFTVNMVYLDKTVDTIDAENRIQFSNLAPPKVYLDATELGTWQDESIKMYDFRSSRSFQNGCIVNSKWQNISAMLGKPPHHLPLAIIAHNMTTGSLIANCLMRHGWKIAGVYIWNNADFDQSKLVRVSLNLPLDESTLFAGRHSGVLQDAQDYLEWEENLPEEIDMLIHDLWCRHLDREPKLD